MIKCAISITWIKCAMFITLIVVAAYLSLLYQSRKDYGLCVTVVKGAMSTGKLPSVIDPHKMCEYHLSKWTWR